MRLQIIMAALVTTLCASTTAARAEDQILYAECGDSGCSCMLSPVTLGEYEALMGTAPPPGAENMVLVNNKGEFIWSPSSADEIDLAAGGDGTCEIEVFPIIPQDGTWLGSVRVQDVQGCPPKVDEMVPPIVDNFDSAQSIVWNGKFHPSEFVIGDAPDRMRWTERSSTQFDGVFPVPPNDTLDVSITATATLTAPDKAEATVAIRIAGAPGVDPAALALLGMADCRVDAVYDFTRTGP
jgi:hypothetical protein